MQRRPPGWRDDPATARGEWPERLPRVVHPTQDHKYAVWRRPRVTVGETLTEEVLTTRVARVIQWVEDFACKPFDQLRVLDLGCYDGRFSIPLAQRGAEVLGIDGRATNLAPGLPVAESLPNLTLVHGDVRDVSDDDEFDVVLCLGILYHLQADEVFALLHKLGRICRRLVLIETQISLSPRRVVQHADRDFWGADYPEDTARPGASLNEPQSFWFTKPSLLNLLSLVGFRSVGELLTPTIPRLAAFADHVVLAGAKQS